MLCFNPFNDKSSKLVTDDATETLLIKMSILGTICLICSNNVFVSSFFEASA